MYWLFYSFFPAFSTVFLGFIRMVKNSKEQQTTTHESAMLKVGQRSKPKKP
jgi:hypothetical protein